MTFRKLCQVLGTGLGVGLATYSAIWLMRKLSEDDYNWFGQRGSGLMTTVPMKTPSHYIRVPVHLVPKLIGDGGQNIRQMEAETHTVTYFEDKVSDRKSSGDVAVGTCTKDPDDCDDWIDHKPRYPAPNSALMGYRLMSIRGAPKDVNRMVELVTAMIKESDIEAMVIPDGCNIVGYDGSIINEISDQSGARLKLEGNRHSTNRSVYIIGNDKQRGCAKRMINKIIDEFCDQTFQTIE